jgi:hypothetical protein
VNLLFSVDDGLFLHYCPIKQFVLGFALLSYIIYIALVLEIKTESFVILYCAGTWRNNERNGCESIDTIMHY